MTPGTDAWRPSATREILEARAGLYDTIRTWFRQQDVLEVETPLLGRQATVDVHIESFQTRDGRWLQTSPEFAMKRLLAAGSGPIFQFARAFRLEEAGRFHNPEFTLLEWYRPGFDHHQLMEEVQALLHALGIGAGQVFERLNYREAFLRHAGLDPYESSLDALRKAACEAGADLGSQDERDLWLDVLMSLRVGPELGRNIPVFILDFPASQAALARIRPGNPPVAERFELFWQGIELANGFHELLDARLQQLRFEAEQALRAKKGRDVPPYDADLIAALAAGMPASAGVALGMDRLLMLKLGLPDVASTLAFCWDRAD